MKRIKQWSIIMLTATMLPLCIKAQEANDTTAVDDKIITQVVPAKGLPIRDKIFIHNKSPFYVLQVAVAVQKDDGELSPIGTATYLAPDEKWELASYEHRGLGKLRGKTLAIKVKGCKIHLGKQDVTNVTSSSHFPFGFSSTDMRVKRKTISQEMLSNVKPSDITYDFSVTFSESNHDLYIELHNKGKKGIMDF